MDFAGGTEIEQRCGRKIPAGAVSRGQYWTVVTASSANKPLLQTIGSAPLEAAAGNARKLITLAQYAEQNKETEIAEVAYKGAAAAAPKLRMALASMVIGSD